jgi:NAD(P)-dependent dehydrogenase (short-subunit alcohol dehydrogenase family)
MSLNVPAAVRATRRIVAAFVMTISITVSSLAAQGTGELRAVLVTGATSGIGLRMTEVLSENGFFVYAGARKTEDMARLNAMANVKSVRLDVTVQSDIDAGVALIEAEGRGLYGLINNAGVSVVGPLIEISEADMQFVFDVNVFGPYRVTKAFANLIIDSQGRILNVSSIAGIVSGPFGGVYSMSKHGVEAYTDSLAAELARFNVAVAAVEPGNYKSRIVASMVERMKRSGYLAEGSRYRSMLGLLSGPVDRSQHKEPDEVALAALDFLSSDSPKRRYMVVPNKSEAEITIRQVLRELTQLNDGHAFSYDRNELIRLLDETLAETAPSASRTPQSRPGIGLHEAALTGNLQAVRQGIEAGADLNAKDPSGGSSPLIIAATFGRTEVAKALIAAGADVNQQNNDGSTALLTAALFCHSEIVEALLAAGADKRIRSNTGSNALEVVSVPFEDIKATYDYIGAALKPYGLELDYERIRKTRPKIAEMLR